jgi:hypothetical protein
MAGRFKKGEIFMKKLFLLLVMAVIINGCGQPLEENGSSDAEITLTKILNKVEQLRNEISHGYSSHPESEYYEGKYETATDALKIVTDEINIYYENKLIE